MPQPKIIVCSTWRPNAVSLPLEDDETLVSSVIELQCDDPVGVDFTGITLALSHSAVESKQYELVMKERVNREDNTWKDLETASGMVFFILTNKKPLMQYVAQNRVEKLSQVRISQNIALFQRKKK